MDGWFNEEISRPDRIETECRRNKLGEWASAGREAAFNYRTLRDNVSSVPADARAGRHI